VNSVSPEPRPSHAACVRCSISLDRIGVDGLAPYCSVCEAYLYLMSLPDLPHVPRSKGACVNVVASSRVLIPHVGPPVVAIEVDENTTDADIRKAIPVAFEWRRRLRDRPLQQIVGVEEESYQYWLWREKCCRGVSPGRLASELNGQFRRLLSMRFEWLEEGQRIEASTSMERQARELLAAVGLHGEKADEAIKAAQEALHAGLPWEDPIDRHRVRATIDRFLTAHSQLRMPAKADESGSAV
jgi:hypothetical protein